MKKKLLLGAVALVILGLWLVPIDWLRTPVAWAFPAKLRDVCISAEDLVFILQEAGRDGVFLKLRAPIEASVAGMRVVGTPEFDGVCVTLRLYSSQYPELAPGQVPPVEHANISLSRPTDMGAQVQSRYWGWLWRPAR